MSSNAPDWRTAVAEENKRLGINSQPTPPTSSRESVETLKTATPKWDPPLAGRSDHRPGVMNKLEGRYAQHLELRRVTGEIRRWEFEPIKLRLADRTFWTVDFLVVLPDNAIELHEVKGHWEDDARVKIKVAAKDFPEFQVVGVTRPKKSDWKFEYFPRGARQ